VLYAEEYGLDWTFELYIAKGYAEAVEASRPAGRALGREDTGKIVGSIAIVGHTPEAAQLRWFLLHPSVRGRGLGRRLLKEAIEFSRASGYQRPFCGLSAIWMPPFICIAPLVPKDGRGNAPALGKTLTEERYELALKPEWCAVRLASVPFFTISTCDYAPGHVDQPGYRHFFFLS